MSLKSGSIEQFKRFSQFKDIHEYNVHLEMWLAVAKEKFTRSELVGLKRLTRFAAKVPGIANAKIATMLKAIHEEYEGNGISRSTFKRMIQKAIEIGILTINETERKNGSQSSNLYIFQRFASPEPPKREKMNHPQTSNLSKTTTKYKKCNEPLLDHTYTSDKVPKPFVELVKIYFSDAKSIEEFWRMTLIAAYHNNRENEKEVVLEMAILAFKQMIRKQKMGNISKPIAYYYGILIKKWEQQYFEDLYERGFPAESNTELAFYIGWMDCDA
ncbi:hypothetical protein [Cytobacillus gottheilii]|uniref:hypothetical protein n=1 Tax=Cytobacillus gottheilii TaxID=859144 RepID=UPI00249524E8|nr:hypothetical protein [Cytobacillus gottheilii]